MDPDNNFERAPEPNLGFRAWNKVSCFEVFAKNDIPQKVSYFRKYRRWEKRTLARITRVPEFWSGSSKSSVRFSGVSYNHQLTLLSDRPSARRSTNTLLFSNNRQSTSSASGAAFSPYSIVWKLPHPIVSLATHTRLRDPVPDFEAFTQFQRR